MSAVTDRAARAERTADATNLSVSLDALKACRGTLADCHAMTSDTTARATIGRYVMLMDDMLSDAREDVKGALFDLGVVE